MSGGYELGASIADDPLDVLTDVNAAIRNREPIPWRLLESVGVRAEHIAPELRLRDGSDSLMSEIASRYLSALHQAVNQSGRQWPVPLLRMIEQEASQLDHGHDLSSEVELAVRPLREWVEWCEMVNSDSFWHEKALGALARRWQRDCQLEAQDVAWLLAELQDLETPCGANAVALPGVSASLAPAPELA